MFGRSVNVYVLPASVGAGAATARSPTTLDPSEPPTRRNPVKPSPERLRSCQPSATYDIAGSRESMPLAATANVNVPPRCAPPAGRTVTQTPAGPTAIPVV